MALLDKTLPNMSEILERIEHDHAIFMRLLMELAECLSDSKRGSKKARNIFERLEKQVTEHMAVEEQYMALFGYGESNNHLRHHEEFRVRCATIHQQLLKDDEVLHVQISSLVDWLLTHIHKVDNRLISFLRMRMLQSVLKEIELRLA